MPSVSSPQNTKVTNLRTLLVAAKTAIKAVEDASQDMRDDLAGLGTEEATRAGIALYDFEGQCGMARMQLKRAHSTASLALIDYDPPTGVTVVNASPSNRR